MKYQFLNQSIPSDSRQPLNEKILYLIDNGLAEASGITKEDIFNAYTGDGGLHGLKFKDYANYHSYSEAKKEIECGQFFTPANVCNFIMDCINMDTTEVFADLTCGMGNFFNYTPMEGNGYGCELDQKAFKVAKYLYPKANLTLGDIRSYNPGLKVDYVVGNPPFHLKWWVNGEQVLSQLYYCQKAAEVLKPLGIMAIVVPHSFLADDFSDGGLIKEMEKHFSFLGQFSLCGDTFSSLGVTGFPTKVQFWQKNSEMDGWEPKKYNTNVYEGITLDAAGVSRIRELFVKEAQDVFRKKRTHILLELSRARGEGTEFDYKVKKYLYDIKHHPRLMEKYVKCCEYVSRYLNQKQPEGMSYEEWCRIRLTEGKVLAYLRSTISKQHPAKYKDQIRMVYFGHSFGYKAYSPKMARQMTPDMKKRIPTYQIVHEGVNIDKYGNYAKMLRRRQRAYQVEQQQLDEMKEDKDIKTFLDAFSVYDTENEELIRLNDVQKSDINKVLQKRYQLLQWEQGSGKTLAGIVTGMYRMQKQNAFCTWVVSNAISINNNWDGVLKNYRIRYIMIRRIKDLKKIKRGDFVIITLDILSKYQRQIKSWIKQHGRKVNLCFDESDEITNPSSVRTKAVLNVFRRCKFKLLLTGTSTRNNVGEFFPQLELAYNNSVNMLSWCPTIYHYERANPKKGIEEGLQESNNPYYGKPFPAYKKGYKLFSASHLPEKITVFGVKKKTQDIYNADELNRILGRFVITRTFEEVSGKNIKKIHQIPVVLSEAERAVYQQAIDRFGEIGPNYFASTGNSRKDSMMKLIQQITLLLRISAAPNTVAEYVGGTPTKIRVVMDMLSKMENEIVVIGVRHKIVIDAYAQAIRERFPNRKLFVVTGSTASLAKRRALRKTLKESGNSILLCTQQSLPTSVNYEYVNKVIIPEMHFNNARMSQFYFRFIRYNSEHVKDIYFVTYLGSIESNQMQMILAKEKINLFMHGKDVDLDEVYQQFGIDYNLLDALMSRTVDKDGKLRIEWGKQYIGISNNQERLVASKSATL